MRREILFLWLATCSFAHQLFAESQPGTTPVDFELRDLDGTLRKLSDLGDRKAIVLAFLGVDCPISRQHVPGLVKLFKERRERGVEVLLISSNRQDEVPRLRAFAHELGIEFPILKDHGARVADLLGAERVPEVFVLDASRVVRYRGLIDDQFSIGPRSVGVRKDHPEARYLLDALDAVLDGKEVKVEKTQASGCVIGREPTAASTPSPVTFHEHVEPILQRKCQGCHRPGQIGPFSLLSYDDAAGWEGMIAEVVENGRMPPWHAEAGVGKFSNDRSLSADEKSTILQWTRSGAPRGDPSKAPAPRKFEGDEWSVGKPDQVFEIPRSYLVPARGTVKYQYFTVDTGFTEDKWIQAIEVRAGNRSVVHHILIFAADPKDPKRWQRETHGGTQGYFAAMVPGERPVLYPDGMGKKLPAGSTLVFQIHYTTNGVAAEDRSRIGLVFAKEKVTREVRTRTAVNLALRIPAGAERHEVSAQHTFTRPTTLLSFLPHMHLRGAGFRYDLHSPARAKVSRNPFQADLSPQILTRMRYDPAEEVLTWIGAMDDSAYSALSAILTEPSDREALDRLKRDGRTEPLLSVPAYDFGWQSSYVLDQPRTVAQGTVLECVAAYNNSPSNPALTREMWQKTVKWGEQTWEEMMIGYFDCVASETEGNGG